MPHRHLAAALATLSGGALYFYATRSHLGAAWTLTWAEAFRVAVLLLAAHLVFLAAQLLGLLLGGLRPRSLTLGYGMTLRDIWVGPVLLTVRRWPLALAIGWVFPRIPNRWRTWLPHAVPVLVFAGLLVALLSTLPGPADLLGTGGWRHAPVPDPSARRLWWVSAIGVCLVALSWLVLGWSGSATGPARNAQAFQAVFRRNSPALLSPHRNVTVAGLWFRLDNTARSSQALPIIDRLLALSPGPEEESLLRLYRTVHGPDELAVAVASAEHLDRYPESEWWFPSLALCFGTAEAMVSGLEVPAELVARAREATAREAAILPPSLSMRLTALWLLADGHPDLARSFALRAARRPPNRNARAQAQLVEALALIELGDRDAAVGLLALAGPHLNESSLRTAAEQRLAG
ncbi:hypothetical protein R8Z50_02295 [Longispora sp. K20-0274]|uniref:hypothetical protein n=1 Tax=Longispora sp. K20-0274 TaxID=3088255 RepID=UPI003999FDC7